MKKLLANLALKHRIAIALAGLAVAGGIYYLVQQQKEADFKPLFSALAPEDAAAMVQKLKEGGVEYRLPETGGAVLVPSARIAELRLTMAAVGLPKTGRIGFELFDKTNLGATEFTEHVNFRRALEGELERSVMSLAEVEQARVHLTFPKDSVFLDAQQPAKASVLVKIKPGARLSPKNVQAINHLVSSAVEGLTPDAVSVLDMNGNLLGKPKKPSEMDGEEVSEEALEYRRKLEQDLLTKVNATLEPLLGAERYRTGLSVDCDFSGSDQSEEVFDPAHSVMSTSERSEDSTGGGGTSGVPGTPSTLPRPSSRPASGAGTRTSRMTENITYQTSRLVKKTRTPAGNIRRMSLSVLVDQDLNWQLDPTGYKRVLVPPGPEKLKSIHDVVAGIIGFNAERGDQIIVETLPFENTLLREPPPLPESMRPHVAPGAVPGAKPSAPQSVPFRWTRNTMIMAGGAGVLLLAGVAVAFMFFKRKKKKSKTAPATVPTALPEGAAAPEAAVVTAKAAAPAPLAQSIESKLAEQEAAQQRAEAEALSALKLAPVITKAAEVMAKHLREKIKNEPDVSAQVLRTWIREEEA